MDKPPPAAQPPLRIWFFLALTATGLLAGMWFRDAGEIRNGGKALDKVLLDRAAAGATRPVVLVIGTSLTQSGLDSTNRITACVQESTGKQITLLKCWVSGGDLRRIAAGHEAAFRQLKPDLVLIEANLLFYRPARTPLPSLFAQNFRDMLAGRSYARYDPDQKEEVKPAERSEILAARLGLVDTTDLSLFRDLCAAWQRGGTHIGLVNIPVEQELEKSKWHSGDTSAFNRNLRYLRQTGAVDFYDPQLCLDSSYFFDFGHLNRRGNARFAPWFCGLLSKETGSVNKTDRP